MQRTATVQTRGRVTLPVDIRQALQIAPGDDIVFVETAPGRFELKAEARRAALLSRSPASRLEAARGRGVRQLELSLPAGRTGWINSHPRATACFGPERAKRARRSYVYWRSAALRVTAKRRATCGTRRLPFGDGSFQALRQDSPVRFEW